MNKILLCLFAIPFGLYCSLPSSQQGQKRVSIDQARIIAQQSIYTILEEMFVDHPGGNRCNRYKKSPIEINELPFWLIKTWAASRLQGAAILNACINERQLELLYIPYKEKFDVGDIPEWINPWTFVERAHIPKELCIAEKVSGCHGGMFSKKHTGQIVDLIEYAERPYIDWHNANTVFMPDGRIAVIDTEMIGFSKPEHRLFALESFERHNKFDDEAFDLLQKHIKDMKD